jgi:uncharacterized protein
VIAQNLTKVKSLMLTRRQFLRRTLQAGGVLLASAGAGVGYGFWEASQINIKRSTVAVPNLPDAFAGKTIGVLADLHHGRYVGIEFIRAAVRMANELQPDLFLLLGDYGDRWNLAEEEIPPCLEALSELRAPLGVYAVPGNHDMKNNGRICREAMATTPITDLTNRHQCITCKGEDLWLAGVDDYWYGRPNLAQALAGIPPRAAVVLLCHNPDFAEDMPNARVGLVLSGHTHGGQVYLPVLGAPWIPSRYGEKYLGGLVQGPASSVFVSRGLGEAGVPIRFCVPPEINLLTVTATA